VKRNSRRLALTGFHDYDCKTCCGNARAQRSGNVPLKDFSRSVANGHSEQATSFRPLVPKVGIFHCSVGLSTKRVGMTLQAFSLFAYRGEVKRGSTRGEYSLLHATITSVREVMCHSQVGVGGLRNSRLQITVAVITRGLHYPC
jgi:hypothetical protein